MTFHRILCPIDFSPGSQKALKVAARFAKQVEAELVVAHSYYVPPMAFAGELTVSPVLIQQHADDAQLNLDAAVRDATALGVKRVTAKLATGVPWHQIVEIAADAFDLVVIGTHGRTGLARVMLGSVAEKVVRHASCSVMAVHPNDDPKRFARVLCPVDFSDSSRHAVDLAVQLVEPEGGDLTLLHVIDLPLEYFEAPQANAFLHELDKRSAATLEEWAAPARAKVPVSTLLRMGNPGAQTLALLGEPPAFDLVVTGSHGRTGLQRALLGSVAEKIVRHAPCPVLVARQRT